MTTYSKLNISGKILLLPSSDTRCFFKEYNQLVQDDWKPLFELQIVGERILDHELKYVVLDGIVAHLQSGHDGAGFMLGVSDVEFLYEGTPAKSPVRQLLAQIFKTCGRSRDKSEDLPPAFRVAIIKACTENLEIEDFVTSYHTAKACATSADMGWSAKSSAVEDDLQTRPEPIQAYRSLAG